jgi:hypothetical protein
MQHRDTTIKLKRSEIQLRKYHTIETLEERLQFLQDSPLRFSAFSRTALADPDSVGFITELELDMGGEIRCEPPSTLFVSVCEIKGGRSKEKAFLRH